jgi:glycosyltransferase involved in cell wall biosynthesis
MDYDEIIFVGGVFDEREILKRTKGLVQIASNTLQWALIKGMYPSIKMKILSSVYVGTFPKYHRYMYEKSYKWKYEESIPVQNVGFLNLFFVKNICRCLNMTRFLIGEIMRSRGDNERKVILVYGMHSPFMLAALFSRIFDKRLHLSIVITDLPNYMGQRKSQGKLFRFFKSLDSKLLHYLVQKFDSFVLLTEQMRKVLKVENKPYVVVEGAVDATRTSNISATNPELTNSEKIVLYTGGLNARNGVADLVKAFRSIKREEYRLWVCGEGDDEELLRSMESVDSRIRFFGLVSKDEVFELQSKATVLVNPRRDTSGEYTKYSFPSKTMEYLMAGKPVIAYKLQGIPNEYDEFISYVRGDHVKDLAEAITAICELSERDRTLIGEKGRHFVLTRKSGKAQAAKVLRMLSDFR